MGEPPSNHLPQLISLPVLLRCTVSGSWIIGSREVKALRCSPLMSPFLADRDSADPAVRRRDSGRIR